jgi:hypothetical protein
MTHCLNLVPLLVHADVVSPNATANLLITGSCAALCTGLSVHDPRQTAAYIVIYWVFVRGQHSVACVT